MILEQKLKERLMREFFRTHSYPRKNAVDGLLTDKPFNYDASWRNSFVEAMRYSFSHHSSRSEFYKRLCQRKNFTIGNLKSFEEIWAIPFIMSDIFKFYNIETKTTTILKTEITSSGTSGRRSRVILDAISGQRLLYSTYHVYRSLGLEGATPTNYLMMAYSPGLDATRATTNSDVIISYLAPRKNVFYALDADEAGGVGFLKEKAVERLRDFVRDGSPIRILGFLHHTCEVIKSYNEKYGRVEFPKESYILSGGGWKTFAHLYGEDFNLFKFLEEYTTIETKNVRDLYTLNEHAIFYLECEEHNMHMPNVAIACTRNPRTLQRLPYGERGLVHLYSPLVESTPFISILTTDYGYIKERCTCPIGGPYLKIIGRAGVTKKMTCTLTADQYINSGEKEAAHVG